MKRGFTLIELLAVIVILALIALITIPAVLRITENAKISSYRRSIDLYGRAISTAIQAYKSDKVEKRESYQINFDNIIPYVDYEGYDITCEISRIYSDETILLTKCSIENDIVSAEKGKGYGTENYYYYTNSKKRIKALLYIEAVNKALEGKENIGNSCQIENSNLTCNNQPIEVTGELGNPKSGTLTIANNQVTGYSNLKFEDEKVQTWEEVPQVVDEQQINTNPNNDNSNTNNQNNNNNTNTQTNLTNTTDNYIGYYADVDGDGTVDGVIYSDLAHSKEETTWGRLNLDYAKYSYEAKEDLKEYTISENKYIEGNFGEKEIITLKPGTTGESRFYVMALSDFTNEAYTDPVNSSNSYETYTTYYWYTAAYGNMNTTITSTNFGTGKENTRQMIDKWNALGYGTQNKRDIWKHIQNEYKKGWYIPSVGEWVAFADYLANREEAPLTSDYNPDANNYSNNGNYDDVYGLSGCYWSSSQYGTYNAWYITFDIGPMYYGTVFASYEVRLSATF